MKAILNVLRFFALLITLLAIGSAIGAAIDMPREYAKVIFFISLPIAFGINGALNKR